MDQHRSSVSFRRPRSRPRPRPPSTRSRRRPSSSGRDRGGLLGLRRQMIGSSLASLEKRTTTTSGSGTSE